MDRRSNVIHQGGRGCGQLLSSFHERSFSDCHLQWLVVSNTHTQPHAHTGLHSCQSLPQTLTHPPLHTLQPHLPTFTCTRTSSPVVDLSNSSITMQMMLTLNFVELKLLVTMETTLDCVREGTCRSCYQHKLTLEISTTLATVTNKGQSSMLCLVTV